MDTDLTGKTLAEAEKIREVGGKSWTIEETSGKLRGTRSLLDAQIIRVIEHKEHIQITVSYF